MSDIGSAQSVVNQYLGSEGTSIALQIGQDAARSALHLAFPNDFEYYMCALELVRYDGSTIDYFTFPVNPESMSIEDPRAPNIRKTMGGVSVVGNSSFVPIQIMMSGNFGRKFKMLVGKAPDVAVAHYSTTTGVVSSATFQPNNKGKYRKISINPSVKTGYGAIKILEAICNKSHADIDGKPNQLYLYNPAFGCNYLVKVTNFKASQSQSSNMIWSYDLRLTAVAPLDAILGEQESTKRLAGALAMSIIQNAATSVLDTATNLGSRAITAATT